MAYYDDRPYYTPRDRRPKGTAADYYDDHPDSAQPRGYSRFEREIYPNKRGDDSVEEIPRHFPPGEDYVYERGYNSRRPNRPAYGTMRRASSVGYDSYYDDRPRRSRTSRQYDDRRE